MKRFLRVVRWIIFNAAALAALWYGTHGTDWCWNLWRFWAALVLTIAVLGVFCMAASPESLAEAAAKRSVPASVDGIPYGLMIGYLAALGHFGWAIAIVLLLFFGTIVHLQVKDYLAKQKEKSA